MEDTIELTPEDIETIAQIKAESVIVFKKLSVFLEDDLFKFFYHEAIMSAFLQHLAMSIAVKETEGHEIKDILIKGIEDHISQYKKEIEKIGGLDNIPNFLKEMLKK